MLVSKIVSGGQTGVEKDMDEAVKWIRKAAKQGHPQAKEILEN